MNTAIVRVKVVFGSDSVLIADVAEMQAGLRPTDRVVRSSALARGGTDSFWKVSGESSEPKPKSASKGDRPTPSAEVQRRPGKGRGPSGALPHSRTGDGSDAGAAPALPPLVNGESVSFPTFEGSKAGLLPSATFGFPSAEAHADVTSFKEVVRLTVGYRPIREDAAELIDALIAGTVKAPIKARVDVIDLGDGYWLRDSEFIERGGTYRFATDIRKFAVPVVSVPAATSMIAAGATLVLFAEPPLFEDRGTRDFRTEEEVLQSADDWLARISESLKSTDEDRARIAELRGLLTKYTEETVGDHELDDLFATLTILEQRPTLIDALPDILNRDAAWSARVQAIADEEVARKLSELESRFRAGAVDRQNAIDALDATLLERQDQLSRLSERERAYRDALADIEESLGAKIDSVVARRIAETKAEAEVTRKDWLDLKGELERIGDAVKIESRPIPAEPPAAVESAAVPPRDTLTRQQRTAVLADLASTLSVGGAKLLLGMTLGGAGLLPVFVGSDADVVAMALARSVSDEGTVVFCDPTLVSLQDVLGPAAASGRPLSAAIETAKAHPDILFPVALCGLTKAPCEFWLTALLDGQRSGYFPSNLRLIATTASDGIRVPLPHSLLRAVVPIDLGVDRIGSVDLPTLTRGTWPTSPADQTEEAKRLRIALQDLLEVSDRSTVALLGRISSNCEALVDIAAADLVTALKDCLDWLADVRGPAPSQHASTKYFQKFED